MYQFFMELMKVPRIEAKLRVFGFKITFASQVEKLNSLNVVAHVFRHIVIDVVFWFFSGGRVKRLPQYNKRCYQRGIVEGEIF